MTNRTTYQLLYRLLNRAEEVATEPDISASIFHVYTSVLAPVSTVFVDKHEAVALCESKAGAAKVRAANTLALFEPLYREARAVVLAFEPTTSLPDTLKSLSTDTDIVAAITTLTKIVKSYEAEVWAKGQLNGVFGSLGPKLIAELKESTAASKALIKARQERAASYAPAYDKYLSFKRVVRNAMGSSSPQHMRLRLRAKPSQASEVQAEETAPDSGVLPFGDKSPKAA